MSVNSKYRLRGVSVANLRGFESTSLEIEDGVTLLVGPNNSGKTSILRLLNWFFNEAETNTLSGLVPLTGAESEVLLPARPVGKRARRLTLKIEITDGRSRRRYPANGDYVDLRVTAAASGLIRLNVGPPRRPEEEGNTELALELYEAVQAGITFTLIPAARDAASETFRRVLRSAAVTKLEEKALRQGRGRAPAESKVIREAVEEIRKVGTDLLEPLWTEIRDGIPPGLAESANMEPRISRRSLIDWLADNAAMNLVTGDHDRDGVDAVEVGSGLQSLLEIAITRAAGAEEGVDWILAIEEPEAFLHPSAQRTLARLLRSTPGRLLVSTHSAVLVDEAQYGEVVLARDHHFYEPRPTDDARRSQINSALLTGHGAEMAFASSLLLVEGEGDRIFFERLRRRLAVATSDSRLDRLYVLPVEGKTNFAPWIRLVRSYGELGNRPIAWQIVADDDAAWDVRTAYSEARVRVPGPMVVAARDLREAVENDASADEVQALTLRFNALSRRNRQRIWLLPGQLEGAALAASSEETREMLAEVLAPHVSTERDEMTRWLKNHKWPWMRAVIGDRLPWAELDEVVTEVLVRWVAGVTGSRRDARTLVAGASEVA